MNLIHTILFIDIEYFTPNNHILHTFCIQYTRTLLYYLHILIFTKYNEGDLQFSQQANLQQHTTPLQSKT